MKAIISDIHSNLEAFQAVLDDIKSQNITEVYCLGDVVGYGPNPRECIDLDPCELYDNCPAVPDPLETAG